MGKKNRNSKPVHTPSPIGTPIGFKLLGKPLHVVFGKYSTEHIENIWVLNSEDGDFTSLTEHPILSTYPLEPETGYSLGIIVFNDPEQLILTQKGYILDGELLPFKVGEPIGWRNPRVGHLLDENPETIEKTKESAKFYTTTFPGWENIYKIEQVTNYNGWSDSLNLLIDKQIQLLFT